MAFRLRPRRSERPWWKLDGEVMESLVDLLVKIIGVTVKDKILRAVLVATVVGVGNFAETEDGASAPAVEVGK